MKSGWMKGTVILTGTAFFVKLLSLLYKVPYQNLAGDEGLYNVEWDCFTDDYFRVVVNVWIQ